MSDFFFSGCYEHQLDAKRRIRIPAKLKSQLGENYAITVGTDHCLWILPSKTITTLRANLQKLDNKDPKARAAKRMVLEQMFFPEEDPQGRLVLPRNLITYAGIDKDILFVGNDSYIEIWSQEGHDKYLQQFDLDLAQFIDASEGAAVEEKEQ